MLRLRSTALGAALYLGLGAGVASAACVVDVSSNDVLYLRAGPSSSEARVGSIPHNACGVSIDYSTCKGQWCVVTYKKRLGWAYTRYLSEARTPPSGGGGACVTGVPSNDVLWIRRNPNGGARKVGSIPYDGCGVRVDYGACSGPWCRVRYRGVSGWAHTRYLR